MNALQVIVKTPVQEVLQTSARSVRVLTESGHVGLRPRMESVVLAVEPGLVLVHQGEKTLFVGTAGGLLTCDGDRAQLMTPLAVYGESESSVLSELTARLEQPGSEMEIRRAISSIQSSILDELRHDRAARSMRPEVFE